MKTEHAILALAGAVVLVSFLTSIARAFGPGHRVETESWALGKVTGALGAEADHTVVDDPRSRAWSMGRGDDIIGGTPT